MGIKKIIKTILVKSVPKCIKREIENSNKLLVNHNHECAQYLNLSFAQEGEDLILYRLIGDKSNGFYIDVGAHHPFRFSNTFKFSLMGWKGINIDPLPKSKQLFDIKRPDDVNLEIGILNAKSDGLLYHLFDEPALSTFDEGIASKLVKESHYKLENTIRIDVCRLEEVLDRYLPENQVIDFLSIDVEGLDLNVLQSNDWLRYRPKFVLCESLSKTLAEDFKGEISIFMNSQNYILLAKTVNTLIYGLA